MSGYILCQTEKAAVPYYIESISTNIYTLEELCYYLYHNLYLVDDTILNEGLCVWIEKELKLPFWRPSCARILANLQIWRMCCILF